MTSPEGSLPYLRDFKPLWFAYVLPCWKTSFLASSWHSCHLFFKVQCLPMSCLLDVTPSLSIFTPVFNQAFGVSYPHLPIACPCHPGQSWVSLCYLGFWRNRTGVSSSPLWAPACTNYSFSFLELRQVMEQVNLGIPNVLENAIQSQAISHCSQSHRLTHLLSP